MLQIIIGQRGWVWVGKAFRDGDHVRVEDARVIRVWGTEGTSSGLGSLAVRGPTVKTVLEDPCELSLHVLAIVGSFSCASTAWKEFYK